MTYVQATSLLKDKLVLLARGELEKSLRGSPNTCVGPPIAFIICLDIGIVNTSKCLQHLTR